ncbi:MAG: CbiX/SirB N-terminal domain-containing protein [Myxococcaceae bacterium]|nr:CbiX/SirB N-terminal domain-containing protein [Myxococcaceae bacterium]MBH2006138.1 CbiX/SirB N-terminal domain-containing protein [Myxococcaceae bacterium]
MNKKAVILIGHGGVPSDYPSDKISRLRMLEAQRNRNGASISQEERSLDQEIRAWPRTPENDPFCFGVQAIAEKLAQKLEDRTLRIAYNEFCGPSIEEAVRMLVSEGYRDIQLLTTMFTPGGVHSAFEIPEIVKNLQEQYPDVQICYPWPFDLDRVADFLAEHVLKP